MPLDKRLIRQTMKKKRAALNEATFLLYSQTIFNTMVTLPCFKEASVIGVYISTQGEVDTYQLINAYCSSKTIAVPKVEGQTMSFFAIDSLDEASEGYYGILEPVTDRFVAPDDIDLMIVPMLAFDHHGQRVGYGGGFYDRYLPLVSCPTVGLAFSFQEVENAFPSDFDQPLDQVITERGVICFCDDSLK